ncbi:MAG: DEAD/DEAH box helicase [Desulfobacterales bacterium]|nr:DEAD/DEAH box helicase [Desulfobacterales bacterium]
MKKRQLFSMTEYQGLTETRQAIINVLAVQVMAFRQKDLLSCLKQLEVKDDNGKVFTAKHLSEILREMAGEGQVLKLSSGVACPYNVRGSVVKALFLSGNFDAIAMAVLSVMTALEGMHHYSTTAYEQFLRAFQFSLFMKRPQIELEMAYRYGLDATPETLTENPPFLLYFNQPFSRELVDKMPLKNRGKILAHAIYEAGQGLHPAPDLVTYGRKFLLSRDGSQEDKYLLMSDLLFRGDMETHGCFLESFEGDFPDAWAAQMGCRLMIFGENAAALVSFEESLSLKKKRTRKRKIFLDGLPGMFFLFALLKSGESKKYDQALTHIDAALRKDSIYTPLIQGMAGIFLDSLGRPGHGDEQLTWVDYSAMPAVNFLKILICTWKDRDVGKAMADELKEITDRAVASGHTWLEAEARHLLFVLGKRGRNKKRAEKIHGKLGTTSLVSIVRDVPRWEKSLNALVHLGQTLAAACPEEQEEPSQRLVWLLEYHSRKKTADITPRLQKRTKKGGWTKGRAVAMKNLYRNHRTMEGLTDQDKAVCTTIEEHSYRRGYYRYGYGYPKTEYLFDLDAALPALVGHPLIFPGEDLSATVELVSGPPEVRLKKKGRGMRISMSPMPGSSGNRHVLVKEAPERFKLVNFTDTHEAISVLLGKKGLTIPAKARDRAAEAVTALSSRVSVHSDLALPEDAAHEVDADTTPNVHIVPFQEGISAEFWIRPFRDKGSYFKPGKGGRHVFVDTDGTTISATRDLNDEKKRTATLVSLCPTLGQKSPVAGRWQMGDPEEALEFLLEIGNLGEDAVLEWPKGEGFRVVNEVAEDRLELGIQKDREWFKATGALALDEKDSLDLRALMARLDQATGRFIPLDDGKFLALTRSLKERLEALKSCSEPDGSELVFPRLAGPVVVDLAETAGTLRADKAWKAHCKRLAEPVTPDVPGTLAAELRPYQETGFRWLARLAHWGVGACLADDMGLGKTLQAIAGLLLGADKGPSLVVAPLSVTLNWEEECRRFAPTLNPKLFGPGDRDVFLEELGPFDLVIASYGLLQTEADRLAKVSWQTVVLDEAQAIKNKNTKRSKAAMILRAEFRLITTGTPVENRLDELWNLFNFINPGLLGSHKRFRERFAVPVERDGDMEASRRLKQLISPFILRRLKSHVLSELPDKTEVTLLVEMSREEELLYEARRRKAVESIESSESESAGMRHLKILAELTGLRRLCCNPELVAPDSGVASSKLKVFGDTVDDLIRGNHKALVFSQFVGHLKILRRFLDQKDISYQYLDGATPAKERRRRISEFQSGRGDLFLISLKAGGSGLNLTAADYVIHMDPWWNPAVEDQASDRAHRIGQTRPVTVYRLVVKNSIEERIMKLHGEKRDLASNLLRGADMAGKISAEELLALLNQ